MTSAAESFVIALGRASKRGSFHLRGLKAHDRDDVVSAAILDCWENRAAFDPEKVTLDDWFMRALRKARQTLRKGHRVSASQLSIEVAGPDNVAATVEARDALRFLASQLSTRERHIVRLRGRGYTTEELTRKRVNGQYFTQREIHSLNKRLKKLRDLIPDPVEFERLVRQHRDSEEPARIDTEIERLDFAPMNGKDCIPCWKCMYFYGMKPSKYRPTKLADAGLQEAVQRTERQKISIATDR